MAADNSRQRRNALAKANRGLSGVGLFLYAGACGFLVYAVFGASDAFGIALMIMMGVIWLLGATNKLEKGTARTLIVIFTVLGIGSLLALTQGLGTQAAAMRGLTFIIFAFSMLAAVGTFLKIIFGLAGLAMVVLLLVFVSEEGNLDAYDDTEIVEQEFPEGTDEVGEDPNNPLRSHQHRWKDFKAAAYQGKLEIWYNDYLRGSRNRKGLKVANTESAGVYWGNVYQKLVNNDTEYMERVLAMFIEKGQENKLDQSRIVEMIVASVQEIPYKLIYMGDCNELKSKEPHLADLATQFGCKGNVAFGLQSPAEFMYDLQGDCDTRTVFLFTILTKLGYKACILNSDNYGHSMLGVALPGVGKYKNYNGRKYYFWETTAKDWEMGVLPPEMGDVNAWEVVLAN